MEEIVPANVEIIEPENVESEIIMSKNEAQELTKTIQSTASALYILLKKAHDEKAYKALGYNNWAGYIDGEFEFSRTRSYQLINQANVIEQINEAGGVQLFITEREARSIKKKLPEITEKLKEVKEEDLPAEQAEEKVKEVIDESKEDSSEVDMAKSYDGEAKDDDGYYDNEDTGSVNEEWTPDNVDRILKDDDLLYYNNLITTLKFFETIDNPGELGRTFKRSTKDTKELMEKAENAIEWIENLMDEVE